MKSTQESKQPKSTKFFTANFKKYLFEFSLLFLAVFLGFFADSLREENSEKQLAYELAKSFYEELKNDSVTVLSKMDSRIKKERAIEYMITFFKDSSLQTSSKSLSINFLWATTVRTPVIFTPRTVILEQLKSSGSLRYFKNQRLQQLVGDLFVSIEYIHERQELEATVYEDYIEPIMINHMDFEFQRKLFNTGIFDQYVWCRGTVKRFEDPPLLMHKRYAQCRGTDTVLRTLAHLLAAHSRATPKQAKEPIATLLAAWLLKLM
jgi:hypothetical protein